MNKVYKARKLLTLSSRTLVGVAALGGGGAGLGAPVEVCAGLGRGGDGVGGGGDAGGGEGGGDLHVISPVKWRFELCSITRSMVTWIGCVHECSVQCCMHEYCMRSAESGQSWHCKCRAGTEAL